MTVNGIKGSSAAREELLAMIRNSQARPNAAPQNISQVRQAQQATQINQIRRTVTPQQTSRALVPSAQQQTHPTKPGAGYRPGSRISIYV